MTTEDEVLQMDESIFGDLDEMSLPELSDSVWMRLLANALDPDAPPASLDLIPVDLPVADTPDDGVALLGDDWAPDDTDGSLLPDDDSDDEDGSDPTHTPSHDDVDMYGHGLHDSGWESGDSTIEAHQWQDSHDDPSAGGF
jgi:hypothetical protein